MSRRDYRQGPLPDGEHSAELRRVKPKQMTREAEGSLGLLWATLQRAEHTKHGLSGAGEVGVYGATGIRTPKGAIGCRLETVTSSS